MILSAGIELTEKCMNTMVFSDVGAEPVMILDQAGVICNTDIV